MTFKTEARRMLVEAQDYKFSADHLSKGGKPEFGGAATLLGILAFEISLKACFLLDRNQRPKFGHSYEEGFADLSEHTQAEVVEAGQNRFAGHVFLQTCDGGINQDALGKYLEAWRLAFVKGRYSYEALTNESDDDARRRGEEWLNKGGKPEDADFAYYPIELEAMFVGLNDWVERRL